MFAFMGATVKSFGDGASRVYDALLAEPVALAIEQPHQLLLSTGSIAIMAQFAAAEGIVDPLVGYLIAGGIEWTYLRGLATSAKVKTNWTAILTWSAFAIMVVWGVLSVARLLQGDDAPKATDDAVWWLAAAHVVPIAWLSLCSAMCHRAAAQASATEREQAERENKARERKLQEQRDAIQLELERKQSELEIWQKAQEIKRNLKNGASRASVPTSEACPTCGQTMDSADVGLMRSARARGARFNGCKMCRSKEG